MIAWSDYIEGVKHMKKKILAISLATLMAVSLSACSSSDSGSSDTSTQKTTEKSTEKTTETKNTPKNVLAYFFFLIIMRFYSVSAYLLDILIQPSPDFNLPYGIFSTVLVSVIV